MIKTISLHPFQSSFFPCVQKSHEKNEHKNDNFNKSGDANILHHHRPRVHIDHFHVENEENEGKQVITHIELNPVGSGGFYATFISFAFHDILRRFGKKFRQKDSTA